LADLVLLDRDGVVNFDSPEYIKSAAEWRPLPGSLEAIARLTKAGFVIVIVSNQSGVGRGLFSEEALGGIHAAMRAAVEAAGGHLAGVYYCPHAPSDGCACRKPRPGLLERVAADFDQTLAGVPMVGDKLTDIEAARAVGARPILVLTGRGLEARGALAGSGVEVYATLADVATALIGERKG
jgi:D-glycero-D-manno-heptose 1,7-bisphosphate phosphatase